MIVYRFKGLVIVTLALAVGLGVVTANTALAATAPIKEIFKAKFGWEVNKTKVEASAPQAERDVCTALSGNVCQFGQVSSEPSGFANPGGVAVDNDAADTSHYGHVYVAESSNNRVQELTADGQFVSMFGWDVNKTKMQAGNATTQTEKNLCTEKEIEESSGVVQCEAGLSGQEPERLDAGNSIAVDPSSGTVYVGETRFRDLIAAYASDGHFLWSVPYPGGLAAVAAGGPEHLLYVGGEEKVFEYEADGTLKREVTVAGNVSTLAVDATTGELYVVYGNAASVERLKPDGEQAARCSIEPSTEGGQVEEASGLALDSAGHLAVGSREIDAQGKGKWFGSLFDAASCHRISVLPGWGTGRISFNDARELYAAASPNLETGHEVLLFSPLPVGELLASAAQCKAGIDEGNDATRDCSLNGEVDPWGVPQTEVWFQWGLTAALGNVTPAMAVPVSGPEGTEEPPVPVSASLGGLKPSETIHYRLVGEDQNAKAPELLTSASRTFSTGSVPPRVLGAPDAEFVSATRAVLIDQVNPENTNTRYAFQYAPASACASLQDPCPGMIETPSLESAIYGSVGATLEANELQPATEYRDRLVAVNENNEHAVDLVAHEGLFQTAASPKPSAQTGGATVTGVTSATITGRVDPDGAPATYTFELGIYTGAETRYGVVSSGAVIAGVAPVEEGLALSGLQPGTTYAYRIAVRSGYGEATGAPLTFTTEGLPQVIPTPTSLAQLPVPPIPFPAATTVRTQPVKCSRGHVRNKHGKCVKRKVKNPAKKGLGHRASLHHH